LLLSWLVLKTCSEQSPIWNSCFGSWLEENVLEPSLFAAQLVGFEACSEQSLIWNSCFGSCLEENVLEPIFDAVGMGCQKLGLEPGINPIDFDFAVTSKKAAVTTKKAAVTAKKADFTAKLAAGTERES